MTLTTHSAHPRSPSSLLKNASLFKLVVTPDGNCLFRAFASALIGFDDGITHRKLRKLVVKFLIEYRALLEPFIEGGFPFDHYVAALAEDGTWAGHVEIVSLCTLLRREVRVYAKSSTTRGGGETYRLLHTLRGTVEGGVAGPPIRLCYTGNHYDALLASAADDVEGEVVGCGLEIE